MQTITKISVGSAKYILKRKSVNEVIRGIINAKVNGESYTLKFYIPSLKNNVKQTPIEICYCVGKGGVEGLTFWGPKGEPCNGIAVWGTYSNDCRKVLKLYKCQGKGGVEGVTLWGPENCDCAGIPEWGKYKGNPVNISKFKSSNSSTLCSCMGHGNILQGMFLWGPSGEFCGGIQVWGFYDSYCK